MPCAHLKKKQYQSTMHICVIAKKNVCFDAAIQCTLVNSGARKVDRHRLRLRDDEPNDAEIQCALAALSFVRNRQNSVGFLAAGRLNFNIIIHALAHKATCKG